ncbi:hypothetical protein [Sediminicola luteus]|jgi:hypothetical protein|uniref:Uncharacterized protein n=1 Tax=Sediminicola luteus TaxID=319238 RepID=A0A2A4G8Y1_9FLAO|nr:hypothetical protein [Sediminicola luteus]PCE64434.1 hypothetical protein B7P33_09095 [Sediminicola luteus]
MPANPKHLNPNPWHQFAKITAGIIGGYIIAALFHMCLPLWLPSPKKVLITSIYTLYMLWVALLIVPFLFRNGWKAWGLYLVIIAILFGLFYLGSPRNPFV